MDISANDSSLCLCAYISYCIFIFVFCNLDLPSHKSFTSQQQRVGKCYLISLLMVKSKQRWEKTLECDSAFKINK